ncbi:MAG: type II toxin-antitoxin system RelE/ParE family toxin [Gemmatimonadetes bacterium]|nr:type II toxin-antitoxin system RelE/ParE family toxin [Gemmatimonadota bacterium]
MRTPPFSPEARAEAGFLLRGLQRDESLSLPHSRPMPSIGRGCHELRIVDRDATGRIVYHVDADAVVILEVFSKKTKTTPKRVVEACTTRLTIYRESRR